MEQTSRLSIVIDANGAERSLSRLKSVLAQVENTGDDTGQSLQDLGRNAKKTGGDVGGLAGAFSKAKGVMLAFGGVIAGVFATMGAGSIIQTADAMQTLSTQIKLATTSAESYTHAMSEIERIAMANNASLQSVGEMYVSNERALKQLGKSQQEVIAFTENVTKAMKVGGGSAEGQAAALTQLGQALASGVLRGDEFNSISEQAPMIMELLADSLNVTTGELRKMAGEGKLTAKAVYDAMTSMQASDKLAGMVSQSTTTISGALENVKTQWQLAVNSFMNGSGGISQSLAQMILKFAETIPKISEFVGEIIKSDTTKSIIEGVGTAFEIAGAAISTVGGYLKDAISHIQKNSETYIALASGVTAAAVAFGVLKGVMAISALFASGAAAAAAFSAVMTVATGVVGAFTAVMAVLTSPITAAVLVIGALVAAGVYLYRNWDDIKAKATEIFNDLPKPIQTAINNIKSIFDGMVKFVSKSIELLAPIAKAGLNAMTMVWQGQWLALKTVVGTVFEGIKAVTTFGINAIKAIFTAGVTVFASVFNAGFDLIKNIFTTVFNIIKALVRGDMQGVKNAINQGMTNAWNIVKTMVTNIVGTFKNLGSQLLQAGRDAIQGLIDGIGSKFLAVQDKVSEIAGLIPNAVRSLLDIRSPSRVMKELGGHTAEGLAVGITKGTPKAVKAAQKMAQEAIKAVAEGVASLKRDIALFGDDNPIKALKYDIKVGKYGNANTKQLEELTKQKYILEQTKPLLDEIAHINREIQTHGLSKLQIFEMDATKGKYADVLPEVISQYRQMLQIQEQFNVLLEKRNQITNGNEDLKNSYDSLQKQIALFGNQSKLAEFDYDWKNGVFAGLDNMLILRKRHAIQQLEQMQIAQNAKIAFDDIQSQLPNQIDPLVQLDQEHQARLAKIKAYYDSQKALASTSAEQLKTIEQETTQTAFAIQEQYQQQKSQLILAQAQSTFGQYLGLVKAFAGENSHAYRAMFAVEKAFAIAQIIMANKTTLAKAWASAPFPASLGAVAKAAVESGALLSAVQAINPKGFKTGGYTGNFGTNQIAGVVHGQEYVLNANATKRIGIDNLNRLNRGDDIGGNNIVVNVTVNQDGSSDVKASHEIGKNLGNAIKVAVQAELQKERRQGGLLYGR